MEYLASWCMRALFPVTDPQLTNRGIIILRRGNILHRNFHWGGEGTLARIALATIVYEAYTPEGYNHLPLCCFITISLERMCSLFITLDIHLLTITYMCRISSNRGPGLYFLLDLFRPTSKRGRPLYETGLYLCT